jgi:uncharacterized membrane protein
MEDPMRFVPLLAVSGLAAVALAACQPQDPNGDAAPPPADAPATPVADTGAATPTAGGGMDISAPITARGNEPFWSLAITEGTKLKLSRPDHPDLMAEAPGAAMSPGGATWVAKGPKGEQVTVVLKMGACSDGMSDATYPMSAEVAVLNETLKGCAAKTSELPKGG